MNVNPFTLKELRQLTRSRAISGALMFFLFVSVLAAYTVPLAHFSPRTGSNLVLYLSLALSMMFVLVLPVNIFVRMLKERGGKNSADLTLVTPLMPSAIIDGKLCSAFTLMFLFSAAALPFCVAAYLLHGVTFAQMFKVMMGIICRASIAVSITLVIGSIRCVPVLRGVLFGLFMIPLVIAVLSESTSVFMFMFGEMDWGELLVSMAGFATVVLMLRAIAIALLSPKVMERDRALRVTMLVVAVGWFVRALVDPPAGGAIVWRRSIFDLSVSFTVVALMLVAWSMAQQVGYSVRQLAGRPVQWWRRTSGWLFRSGAVNGLAFSLLFGIAVTSVLPILQPYFDEAIPRQVQECIQNPNRPSATGCFVFFAYVAASMMFARALWYGLRRRVRIPPVLVPIIGASALLLWQTIPQALALSGVHVDTSNLVFCLHEHNLSGHSTRYLLWAVGALALGMLSMLPEIVAAFRQRLSGGGGKTAELHTMKEVKVKDGMDQA